jgi:hypothetical protein
LDQAAADLAHEIGAGIVQGDLGADARRVGCADVADDLAILTEHQGAFLVTPPHDPPGSAIASWSQHRIAARVLTAADPVTARRLLAAALSLGHRHRPGAEAGLGPLVACQDWAVDLGVDLRLTLAPSGPVPVAGIEDPLAGPCLPAAVNI